MYGRLLLLVEFECPRATINAVFYSEENNQGIISINQCAILKSVGKVGDRMIQNASIFLFFFVFLAVLITMIPLSLATEPAPLRQSASSHAALVGLRRGGLSRQMKTMFKKNT